MSRRRGYARKARGWQQRYDNRAGPVEIRRADGDEPEVVAPLDGRSLAQVIADGNVSADPRYWSHRRTWSPPGS